MKKAVERTRAAVTGDGKIGVFWHTQGSGKSLSMVFYAHLLQSAVSQPTIVVITDRNDLDNQLYGQFAKCTDFLRQVPVQATTREHLRELLEGRTANGIIFTTMQKFEEYDAPLSTRRNLFHGDLILRVYRRNPRALPVHGIGRQRRVKNNLLRPAPPDICRIRIHRIDVALRR